MIPRISTLLALCALVYSSVLLSLLTLVSGDPFGPGVDKSAFTRKLVRPNIDVSDLLDHHDQYSQATHARHFSHGYTLGYVTPWNSKGYDVAKKFALKFTHISPVWFQIKLEPTLATAEKKSKIKVFITGGHDVDAKWITDVKEAGSNPKTGLRVAIVPRFILEPASADMYVKLAQRPGLQKMVIKKIQAAIAQYDLDGLVLEATDAWAFVAQSAPAKARNDLNAFIMRLGSALKENRDAPKQLVLVVRPMSQNSPYFQNFDFKAVHKFVDAFSLMTYDYTSSGTPGPNAPIQWVKESIKALVGEENIHDLDLLKKVCTGVPFYGYRFKSGSDRPTPIVGHELIKLLKEHPNAEVTYHEQWDEHSIKLTNAEGVQEEIFYPTLHFLQKRLDAARSFGASVSIWELGQGLDIFYDIF